MCVSHLWRDLAIKTVSLWTTLYLVYEYSDRPDSESILAEMHRTLERSKSAPLTIIWDTDHAIPVNNEAIDILRGHIWRLVDLQFEAFTSPLMSDLETILACGGVVPTLESLECSGRMDFTHCRDPTERDKPITTLDLLPVPALHVVFTKLLCLTLVSVWMSCDEFRLVLNTCACLKELFLIDTTTNGYDQGGGIEMPSLVVLDFTYIHSNDLRSFLRLIYPPHLRELGIEMTMMDMGRSRWGAEGTEPVGEGPIIRDLVDFLAANLSCTSTSSPPTSALSKLRLANMFDQHASWEDYVRLMEAMPDLRHLDFHFVKFPPMIDVTEDAIKAHGIMCPKLTRLSVTGVSKDFPFNQLAAILKHRMESGKKLPILEAYPSDDAAHIPVNEVGGDLWAETVANVARSFVGEVTQYSGAWLM
ncbi:hypothetical protein BS47DRAFT_1346672 [Hydnum rufescens UP504]|uniref:F-box domain-containing protein n=1 Tax=Hydnum rufescens UP504 TaxID=1448309 RepID=A0A9P6ATN9_9AGAM|nr:hypothetical protein BS47DRAFT_1346672 [Hydnum rufescens UP504]